MKLALLITCLAVLTGLSTSVTAEKYYKWVDKNGATHYSANPPSDISATLIKIKAGNPEKITDQSDSSTNSSIESNKTDESSTIESAESPLTQSQTSEIQEPTEEQLAVQRTNCATASRKLIALENAGRVRQLDGQTGEYRYLPDEKKRAEISKMRNYLRSNCRDR